MRICLRHVRVLLGIGMYAPYSECRSRLLCNVLQQETPSNPAVPSDGEENDAETLAAAGDAHDDEWHVVHHPIADLALNQDRYVSVQHNLRGITTLSATELYNCSTASCLHE